ncbi:MAG TPA: CPCC family cysteine-rich protein [Nannocystaceae bacterium]|nr:CPCC family cysteine-rich protein [Nannocystaceae bacterium]
MAKYACPCCRCLTLDEAPGGTYKICAVCYWEDDQIQFRDHDYEGGANGPAERLTVVNDALRVLKLGAVPQLPLAHKLSGPGTTVQLGLDFPGAAINAFRAAHVYRSSAGQGSFITLGAPDQMASLDLDVLDSGQGVYLAVVHVAGSANALDARIWLYPNGYIGDTATRSNNKFLIPFEITSYAYLASIYLSLPAGTTGDLDILRVDVTKVT